jgi:hypothetical protein
MTAPQQIFPGQETKYLLGQGKIFFDLINPTTKRPMDKARFVGNVPEDGFVLTPTVQKVEHMESQTGKNRKDIVLYPGQSLQLTVRMENVDVENLAQAIFGTSATIAQGTVTNEIHTAHRGYSFFLNRPNLTSFTSITPTAVLGTDYNVNLKTGEVFIPENSSIADASEVQCSYIAGAINRISGYTATNTELWVRFNGVNMADKLTPIVAEVFKVSFNPASALDFIKNAFPGTQLELAGEALYEPALETVAGYEGGMYRIFTV